MAERAPVPEAWVGREVNVRYADADVPRWLDCTIDEVGELSVCVSAEGRTSFFPRSSVVKIDLGHSDPVRGLRAHQEPLRNGRSPAGLRPSRPFRL